MTEDNADFSNKLNKTVLIVLTITLAALISRETWVLISEQYNFAVADISASSALFGYFMGDIAARLENSEVIKQFWTE